MVVGAPGRMVLITLQWLGHNSLDYGFSYRYPTIMNDDEKQTVSVIPELDENFNYTPENLEDWRKAVAEAMYAVNKKLYGTEKGATDE